MILRPACKDDVTSVMKLAGTSRKKNFQPAPAILQGATSCNEDHRWWEEFSVCMGLMLLRVFIGRSILESKASQHDERKYFSQEEYCMQVLRQTVPRCSRLHDIVNFPACRTRVVSFLSKLFEKLEVCQRLKESVHERYGWWLDEEPLELAVGTAGRPSTSRA